ncbi:putative sporulation protein YtxC [Paenibacillus sepulcri]|uniref:Sporulation protein YtxC n=1 Tax=Paenibacillus sepulcri TaxID=359917 RepID=A0ABS7C3I2_9BACL|nr:putative sporulation protein YtxC [Paenibacillus sepulcri]
MELFTVSLMSASGEAIGRLREYLQEEFLDLHNKAGSGGEYVTIHCTPDLQYGAITCSAEMKDFNLALHGPLVYRRAANAFARYILTEMEPTLLHSIIRKQFHYEEPREIESVEQYCKNLLFGGESSSHEAVSVDLEMLRVDRDRRKNKVAAELEEFLGSNTRIHLDGYVTFRLASYWEELREIAAFAVDEYVMDKQYQEFISLLKYFVRMQEVKLPIVHVVHKGGTEFVLYNEEFQMLEAVPADRIVAEMLETEMNMEDMIVSTLITISPENIVIHTRQPELQVMRTLETIFEQRVQLCVECTSCTFYFEQVHDLQQHEPVLAPRMITAKRKWT